jgi:hypothetical protein
MFGNPPRSFAYASMTGVEISTRKKPGCAAHS